MKVNQSLKMKLPKPRMSSKMTLSTCGVWIRRRRKIKITTEFWESAN